MALPRPDGAAMTTTSTPAGPTGDAACDRPSISVVVPAWNEAAVIERCLRRLLCAARPGELEVVVVCNGCTDDTADRARGLGPPVQVLETAVGSKPWALNLGDAAASVFPRVYVDADVELDAEALRALAAPLRDGIVPASAPRVTVDSTKANLLVRAYYRVWSALPQIQDGLAGRGVYALSGAGHARLGRFPDVVADDLFIDRLFPASERFIAKSVAVRIHPAPTIRELVRRKTRVFAGNRQLGRPPSGPAGGGWRALKVAVRGDPTIVPFLPLYLLVNALAKLRARSASASGRWLREDGSR